MDDSRLTTIELVDRIREEWGFEYDRNTIGWWTRREGNPLPIAYQGRAGQANCFDWAVVRPWLEAEFQTQSQASMQDIDRMDFSMARTMEMRERAKQAQMLTSERAGELVSRREMELEAEDLGGTAVQMLLAISDRIAAQLAHESDETRCAQMIDHEVRQVCNAIAELGRGPPEEVPA